MFVLCITTTGKLSLTIVSEGEVNIAEYPAIFTKPEVNNCFSIVFRGEYEELEENWAKHEKQMRLSWAITPRNPIITSRAVIIMVIIMHNSYIRLSKLY